MITITCILIICITIIITVLLFINKCICHHKWKHIRTVSVWGCDPKYPDHYLDVCRCAKCGKVKKFKI